MDYAFWAKAIVPIIHGAAVFSFVLFVFSIIFSVIIDKMIKRKSEKDFKRAMYYLLDIPYTIFIALISIFPLLGMLGTVLALLNLDISGDTSLMKNNFFQALDTTMWGIVYAAIFKFLNSFAQTSIEAQVSKAKKLLEKTYE